MENTKSGKKTKIYQYIILLLIIATAGYSLYRYLIVEDFFVYARVSCDSNLESCFTFPCEEGEVCEQQLYKVVIKKSDQIKECNAWAGECQELFCEENEFNCEVLYCSDENIVNYEPDTVCTQNE